MRIHIVKYQNPVFSTKKWETSTVYPNENIHFKYFVINVAIHWRICELYSRTYF